jgi:hypothetical protein
VTADERARVEADEVLLAEVDRLRYVQALLAETGPTSISVRETLLANALSAWDRVPATATTSTTTTAPTSLADRRRTSTNRRLMGVAAAIVLVLAGGIVLQTVSSDNDDTSSSSADDAGDLPEVAALAESATEATTATADVPPSAPAPVAVGTLPEGAELDTGINDAAPPSETELEQLSTPEELGIFASDAVGAPQDPDVPAATSASVDDRLTDSQLTILEAQWPLCLGADYVVGPALYLSVEVVVAIDEGRELALAYEAENCREVARARLP